MLTLRSSEREQNDNEQLEEPIQIHAAFDKVDITWTDGSDQAQSIDDVYLKLDIDTLISKALFRLTCRVWLKGKGKNKTQLKGNDRQSVYLFIHPEDIQTIKLEVNDGTSSLHFSMNQGRSRLVIPNDRVLECKQTTLPRLHSLKTLAEMGIFTMHFKESDMTAMKHDLLLQTASIFSSANYKRLETDDRRVDLQSLYNGIGGHVFDTSTTPAGAKNEGDQAFPEDTSAPPPIDYEPSREHKSRKRKRERERDRDSSDVDYDRPPTLHSKSLIDHLLDMENRLRNDMKAMVESTETRLKDDMKHVIESAESRLRDDVKDMVGSAESRLRDDMKDIVESAESRLRDDMKDMIESSEDHLKSHVKDVAAATENQLKEEMNDILDSRADEIDDQVYGAVDNLRTDCMETIDSEFRYLKYGIEEVTTGMEDAREIVKELLEMLNEAGDDLERRVGRYLNGIRLQVVPAEEE
ncbi:hypothetical protein ACQKWADRAFT_314482 [Trichoderma austrokoningii]